PVRLLQAPSAAVLAALRPLLARGPAFIVRDADSGPDARITLVTQARVAAGRVRQVIATPAEYPTFMPIVRSVEILSHRESRTAFRFEVAAPLFNVHALCEMRETSERRVDVTVTQSETGPGGSRWDLFPDGDDRSIVALTTWGDPSEGHWLLRQVARRSPSAIAGMNIATDSVLALGAVRRAEIQGGRQVPMRPASGSAPSGELAPPPPGDWLGLAHEGTVLSMLLTDDGAVRQVTVAAWTPAEPAAVMTRLRDVPSYTRVWGSMREVEVLPRDASDPEGSIRFRSVVENPLSRMEGVQRARFGDNVVWHEGVSGDYVDAVHRFDVAADPRGGSVVMLTGGSDYNRAGWITRRLMERDPWLMAGFAGSWKIVWLRNLLRGM
ncbi:MAG: hypothetical protein JWM10_2977, partial [Myxococcaceae bacterium]|nr:hypothetical protein [Myxococcaceae bacterium]